MRTRLAREAVVGDEPVIIDLCAAGSAGAAPSAQRPQGPRRYVLPAGLVALVLFAGVWIPLHHNGTEPPVPAGPARADAAVLVQGVPLAHGTSFQIDADPANRRASYRLSLTNTGTAPVTIERMYAPVPGLALLDVRPPRVLLAPGQAETVTLTFEVTDCPAAIGQQDERTLRIVVATDLGPVEWQIELTAVSPHGQWQVDLASAACRA